MLHQRGAPRYTLGVRDLHSMLPHFRLHALAPAPRRAAARHAGDRMPAARRTR